MAVHARMLSLSLTHTHTHTHLLLYTWQNLTYILPALFHLQVCLLKSMIKVLITEINVETTPEVNTNSHPMLWGQSSSSRSKYNQFIYLSEPQISILAPKISWKCHSPLWLCFLSWGTQRCVSGHTECFFPLKIPFCFFMPQWLSWA